MQVTTTDQDLPFSSLLLFVFLWTKGQMYYMGTTPPIWEKMEINRALDLDFLAPSPNNRDTRPSLSWGHVGAEVVFLYEAQHRLHVSLWARIFKAIYSLFALLPHQDRRCGCVVKKGGTLGLLPPQWPYLWVSDGGRDIYVNLTRTAWTSWVCTLQAENFMRTEPFPPGLGVGGWLRFPALPVLELLETRQELYFRISVPGPCWNLDTQMCTKRGHVYTCPHTCKYLERGIVHTKPSFAALMQYFPR